MSLMELKSGSDIRGTAVGEGNKLTDEVVGKFAKAFVKILSKKLSKDLTSLTVSVGGDVRISSERIRSAVTAALSSQGVTVYDCGLSSTPAMFMTTLKIPVDGAVQITASHHPYDKNGLKFFTKEGGLSGDDIKEIITLAEDLPEAPEHKEGKIIPIDFMKEYASDLRKMIIDGLSDGGDDKPLKGLKTAVDAGNGVGGFYAYDVLEPLGADISGSQFLEPDGYFPNHTPNPENEEAIKSISIATLKAKADLGIIFDTDVDRAACVDMSGEEINRNRLVALASTIAFKGNEGGTIVTDSVTSDGLKKFIEEKLKGKHHRFKRGYKNVIDEAVKLNSEGINAPLAIETSGHAAFRENYFLDDGAYLITKIIILMSELKKEGKSLLSVISDLEEPVEAKEIRIPINEADFKPFGEKVISDLLFLANVTDGWTPANDNHEGIRISVNDGEGWFLLRLSVHDPLLVLNLESTVQGKVSEYAAKVKDFLSQYSFLNLEQFIN